MAYLHCIMTLSSVCYLSEMCDGSVGMSSLLQPAVMSQLRVLYRSSSSGLDCPKSIRVGSGLKLEPPGGQQEECNNVSDTSTENIKCYTLRELSWFRIN